MKFNTIAWLGVAGLFVGAAAFATACGTADSTSTGPGAGVCGNAVVEGDEECDDGNSNDADGCTNACTKGGATTTSTGTTGSSTCGDGKLDSGEECDDGNDDDTDSCHNNCTSNAPTTCGNGMVDAGEECDDGNKVADDSCTNLCTNPKCGDGIIQAGEDCDDGVNNENNGKCPKDCKNPVMTTASSSSSSGDPCVQTDTFAAVVSNNTNPSQMGSGFASKWTYSGLEGLEAGQAMCQAVNADHVCTYEEVVKAEAAGELANIPTNLSYWLHRTTAVVNPVLNKACVTDAECADTQTLAYCDPKLQMCAYKAGAGARCNDWTYPTGHISDGEYFRVAGFDPQQGNGVTKGNIVYHFDADSFYDGVSTAHLCQSSNKVGCAGACAGAGMRAILCCNPSCP